MSKRDENWIVVNIGCIECGVSSNIVGVFDSEYEARRIADSLQEKLCWRDGGQNEFMVFPMPPVNAINREYVDYLPPIGRSK